MLRDVLGPCSIYCGKAPSRSSACGLPRAGAERGAHAQSLLVCLAIACFLGINGLVHSNGSNGHFFYFRGSKILPEWFGTYLMMKHSVYIGSVEIESEKCPKNCYFDKGAEEGTKRNLGKTQMDGSVFIQVLSTWYFPYLPVF